jgi:hypothetical protein
LFESTSCCAVWWAVLSVCGVWVWCGGGVLQAAMAVAALEAAVDTLIIISNDRLLKGEWTGQQLQDSTCVHMQPRSSCSMPWQLQAVYGTIAAAAAAHHSGKQHQRGYVSSPVRVVCAMPQHVAHIPCLSSRARAPADISDNSTTLTQAFLEADEVLHAGVRGISDIITVRGQQCCCSRCCCARSRHCSRLASQLPGPAASTCALYCAEQVACVLLCAQLRCLWMHFTAHSRQTYGDLLLVCPCRKWV